MQYSSVTPCRWNLQEGWGNLCPKDALGFLSVFPSTAYGDALHATDSERLRLKKKKKKGGRREHVFGKQATRSSLPAWTTPGFTLSGNGWWQGWCYLQMNHIVLRDASLSNPSCSPERAEKAMKGSINTADTPKYFSWLMIFRVTSICFNFIILWTHKSGSGFLSLCFFQYNGNFVCFTDLNHSVILAGANTLQKNIQRQIALWKAKLAWHMEYIYTDCQMTIPLWNTYIYLMWTISKHIY